MLSTVDTDFISGVTNLPNLTSDVTNPTKNVKATGLSSSVKAAEVAYYVKLSNNFQELLCIKNTFIFCKLKQLTPLISEMYCKV